MRSRRLSVHVRLVCPANRRALADEVHDLVRVADGNLPEALPDNVTMLVLSDLDFTMAAASVIVAEEVDEFLVVEFDE